MTVSGSYFWACITRKFKRKLFPLPVAPSTRVCPTSSTCRLKWYGVWCSVSRMANASALQMRAAWLAGVQGEEKAQIGIVRFEQRQATQVVRAVAGDDGEPGVEEVVGLVDERPVMAGQHLDGLGRRPVECARVLAEEHQREGALAEEVAVDLELGEGVAELADGGAGTLVHEHLVGPRVRGDVVHHRDALVEEVPPAESGGSGACGRSESGTTPGRR